MSATADRLLAEATRAYVGVGSNLQQPMQQVRQALSALHQLPDTQFVCCSSMYRSSPLGPADQPDYINAVVVLDTVLSPLMLLHHLQRIESEQGRVRGEERWGPRTLDLDLLLFGKQTIDTDELTVPHPGMHERPFVLYPLYEIAPELEIPGRGALRELLVSCAEGGLERLNEAV